MLLVQFQSGTNIAIDYAHQQSKEIWWAWLVRCRRRRRRWRRDAVRHGARVFVVVVVVVVIFPFCLSFSIDRRDLSTQSILGDDRPFVFFHEKKTKQKRSHRRTFREDDVGFLDPNAERKSERRPLIGRCSFLAPWNAAAGGGRGLVVRDRRSLGLVPKQPVAMSAAWRRPMTGKSERERERGRWPPSARALRPAPPKIELFTSG